MDVGRLPKRSWGVGRLSARPLVALAALCLGVTACGGAGGTNTSASVRPFGLVEVGKTHLQVAADGRSAIVQLETNPPTVCAIAYGRTASLGSIADDPDMDGTAITRHTVVLAGLTPGATYRFRLTATDAQGLVFQTRQLGTFTTPRSAGTLGPTLPSAPRWSPSVRSGAALSRAQMRSTATCRPSGPPPATVIGPSSPSTSGENARSLAFPSSRARCRTALRSPVPLPL